ncbi:MAG: DUF1028 domain-containing protein [Thaumarchaeota archaeon]|nr:DUF1028 domain-containing protein [Nitrososphaerota archaeon]
MTYSIVARDEKTGEMGVAVQSHFFSVGSVVTWARAGVGAVATQAMVDMKYGPLGLEMMAGGKSAPEALDSLLKTDGKRETRQVAMVDSKGRVAAHTGSKCFPYAGNSGGKGFSCQGNIMRTPRVWTSMKRKFQESVGMPLAERLVAALEAGEKVGGDIRGKQSAALLIVGKEAKPTTWEGRLIELRIEDHPDPVPELKRLLRYQRGYDWVNRGDELLNSEKWEDALKAYRKGLELVPEVLELKYWVGLSMLKTRARREGVQTLKEVFKKEKDWRKLTRSMVRAKVLVLSPKVRAELLGK